MKEPVPDWNALHQEAQSVWEQNAAFWDEKMGEGSAFHRLLTG